MAAKWQKTGHMCYVKDDGKKEVVEGKGNGGDVEVPGTPGFKIYHDPSLVTHAESVESAVERSVLNSSGGVETGMGKTLDSTGFSFTPSDASTPRQPPNRLHVTMSPCHQAFFCREHEASVVAAWSLPSCAIL